MECPGFLVKTNGDKKAKAAFVEMLKGLGLSDLRKNKWYVSSLEENIAETFEDQQNTLKIITLFTLIAIVISVMGYVGMSLFFIRQRQKEIAIRKVMGSTSGEVLLLMLRTFSIPMLISFVIAVPISWYIMTTGSATSVIASRSAPGYSLPPGLPASSFPCSPLSSRAGALLLRIQLTILRQNKR